MVIDLERLVRYLRRALRLRCPLCGESPLFRPIGEVRRLPHWFEPLAGCARCGYRYEREPGYWLLSTFVIGYGASVALGFLLYQLATRWLQLETLGVLLVTLPPVALFALLVNRHAKAIFLALDRYIDPTG